MKRHYIIPGILVLAVVCSCISQSPDLEFTVGECDETIDPMETDMGVKEITWVDDTTVVVTVYVGLNCAEEVEGGDYKMIDDRIVLQYTSPLCETCAFCLCAQKLTYKFTNIEKKDYVFEIERIT